MTLVKDLFRRRVPQVFAIYLGASWGIVEFVDFITQRFALSPHLIDLALVGPLLLLPSVILVTYFHGAPGQDQWAPLEKIGIPANLVMAVLFLVVFFQGKDLGAATTTVVVTDEEGVEAERVVPKTEFRKRLTVYFFDAEPEDTAATWLQYGLPMAVLTDLAQDQFIDLRAPILFSDRLREAGFGELVNVPLSLAREIAEEQHRDHFVMGSVALAGGEIQATISLYDAGRGRLLEERACAGADVMEVADKISLQLREDLKIPDLGEEGAQDLPVSEMLTHSPSAYRSSIEGMMASQVERDFARATSLMEEAVAEDSTYADAQSALAMLYMVTNRGAEMAGPMQAAMDHIYRLPERSRFVVKSNYYFMVRQDADKAMAALEMWADLFPDDIQAHQSRLQIQFLRDDKEGALASLETILELDPAQRDVLRQIGALHEAGGDFSAAREAFQTYAEEFPENHQVLTQLAGLARRMGDLDEARDYYDRALLLAPSDVGLMVGMGTLERASGNFDEALAQFDAAMATAGTPEERAQVFSALEAYYMGRGQVERSLEIMEQRLAEAPSYQPGFMVVIQRLVEAGTYAEAGRLEDAWALVEQARTELPPPNDAMAPLGEMDIYLTLEDADAIEATLPAVDASITTLQYEFVRPALVAAQGEAKALKGEFREAIRLFEEQLRLAPASTTVPMDLGRCYRELGEYEQAVAHLQDALRVSPFGPRTNYEMALTYEAMGRMEDARSHLDRSLEVWADADPTYKWARRARELAERMEG
jgi:tetratricopeptide (TPR) repeat protein